jgi:short-subunit dehydrogenase
VLCPGFVNTNLAASMRSSDPQAIRQAGKLISSATTTPEHVAQKVFQAVAKNRFLILTDREGQIVYAIKRLSPALLERIIVKRWDGIRRKFESADSPVASVSTASLNGSGGEQA